MTNAKITAAVAQINRVEAQMVAAMTDAEYRAYMAIPAEDRKQMLFMAQRAAA